MMTRVRGFVGLFVGVIIGAIGLIWINTTNEDVVFDKTEPVNGEGLERQLQTFDLSCWEQGKAPGCNKTQKPTRRPTKAPSRSPTPQPTKQKTLDLSCWEQGLPEGCNPTRQPTDKPIPTPPATPKPTRRTPPPTPAPTVPNPWFALKVKSWPDGGHCTNTVVQNKVTNYKDKFECCESEFGKDSRACLAYYPAPSKECNLDKDSCRSNPACNYNNDCRNVCDGRDGEYCQRQDKCLYVSTLGLCEMTVETFNTTYCERHMKKRECNKFNECTWNQIDKKNGRCELLCGGLETEETCIANENCAWDEEGGNCYYAGEETAITQSPSPAPTVSRFCTNIRKKDKCKAYAPRCTWNQYTGRCKYACELATEESDCDTTQCLWTEGKDDEGPGTCLPNYTGYCETLESERKCDSTCQCEWVGDALSESIGCINKCDAENANNCAKKTVCQWDATSEICRYNTDSTDCGPWVKQTRRRKKKKRLFDRT